MILTVPLSAQVETLKSIRASFAPGAILVDATVPLEIAIGGRVSRTLSLWDGSAAQQAARLVPGVPVVAAFHALSAEASGEAGPSARLRHADLRRQRGSESGCHASLPRRFPGVRAIDAGPLDNARFLESAAALLISLNLAPQGKRLRHEDHRIVKSMKPCPW